MKVGFLCKWCPWSRTIIRRGNAAYINVVVVPQRSKSPEVRLHPLSDPLPHRRARPPRDPNSKTVAWLPSPWGTKGCTHPPSLPVGASIIYNSSNSLWQVLNSNHSSSILQFALVMTRVHLIHPSGWWPRNNSLHNSCVRQASLNYSTDVHKGTANNIVTSQRRVYLVPCYVGVDFARIMMVQCGSDNSGASIDFILSPSPPPNWGNNIITDRRLLQIVRHKWWIELRKYAGNMGTLIERICIQCCGKKGKGPY